MLLSSGFGEEAGHPLRRRRRSSKVIDLVSHVRKPTERMTTAAATPLPTRDLSMYSTSGTAMKDAEASILVRVPNRVVGAGPVAGSLEAIGNGNGNDNNARDASSSGSTTSGSRNFGSNGIILLSTVMTEGAILLTLSLCCKIMIMAHKNIAQL